MFNFSFEDWARFGSSERKRALQGESTVQAEPRIGMRALKGARGLSGKRDGRRGGAE